MKTLIKKLVTISTLSLLFSVSASHAEKLDTTELKANNEITPLACTPFPICYATVESIAKTKKKSPNKPKK